MIDSQYMPTMKDNEKPEINSQALDRAKIQEIVYLIQHEKTNREKEIIKYMSCLNSLGQQKLLTYAKNLYNDKAKDQDNYINRRIRLEVYEEADKQVKTSDITNPKALTREINDLNNQINNLGIIVDWTKYMSNKLNYRVNILDSRTHKLTSPNLVAVKNLEKDMRCAGYTETSKDLTSTLNKSLQNIKQSSDKVYNQALKIVYFKDRQYKNIDIAAFLGLNKKQLENFTYNHKDKIKQAEDSLVQAGGSIAITHAILENLTSTSTQSATINTPPSSGVGNPNKNMSNIIPHDLYDLSRREYEILKRKFILDYVDKNNKNLPGYRTIEVGEALRYYRIFTNNKIFMTNDNLLRRYSSTIKQADKCIINWLISLNKYNEISNQLNHVYEIYPENIWNNNNVSPDDVFADRTYDEAEKIKRHKVMQIVFLKGLKWNLQDIMKRVGVNKEFIRDNIYNQKINVDWMNALLRDMGGYTGIYKIISGQSKLRKDQQGIIDYELMLNVARELQPEYNNSRQGQKA